MTTKWEMIPLKYLFTVFNGATPSSSEALYWNGNINWFTPDDLAINKKKELIESSRKITEEGYESCGVKFAKENSIALSTRAPIGHIAVLKFGGCVNQGCRLLEPRDINSSFYYYFLIASKEILQVLGQGSTFKELSSYSLANYKVPHISLPEQKQIAAFLDYKTNQIDNLIEKKEKLLKLLEEKRIALITNAVTKGIDPNVKMKPTGIDWLGEIPVHWEIKRLRYLANVQLSGVDKKSVEGEKEILLCNYVDVYKNDFIDDKIEFMKASATDNEIDRFILEEGDVIATKDSETPDEIAIPAYVTKDFDNVICGYHLAQIKPRKQNILGGFLFRLFQSKGFNSQFVVRANGITRFGVSSMSFADALVPYPELVEQQRIIDYIEKELNKLSSLSEKIIDAIEKLKEYRSSLITSAVTGKIDVRDWSPKEEPKDDSLLEEVKDKLI
jgi:type I restriction enzyme S subunit